ARLREDVEGWSRALRPRGEVLVVFLGDLVYPSGLPPREAAAWPRDSTRLAAPIATVAGPEARRARARAVFVPGNHDWGDARDPTEAASVLRLEAFVSR